MTSNLTWVLSRFPVGMPVPDDFTLEDRSAPVAKPGELLVRTLWLSVDPYMRARLSPTKNYAAGQQIGEMMMGGGVGEVITSDSPQFKPGDIVQADDFGWQHLTTVSAKTAVPLDPEAAPVQTSLGCLGMTRSRTGLFPGLRGWSCVQKRQCRRIRWASCCNPRSSAAA